MKLNTLLFGLLMSPAVALVGCSDYEDTELTSPQADADAIGAYFPEASQSSLVRPGSTFFVVNLGRANTADAATVAVTKSSETPAVFGGMPTSVAFAKEEQMKEIKVTYGIVDFQTPYALSLSVDALDEDGNKEHIYGAGYAALGVKFMVDYAWEETYAATIEDTEGADVPFKVQKAVDFDKKDKKTIEVVRVANFLDKSGILPGAAGDAQFSVNKKTHLAPALLNDAFFAANEAPQVKMPKEIETGVTQKIVVMKDGKKAIEEIPVFAEFKNIIFISNTGNKFTYQASAFVYAEKGGKYYELKEYTDDDLKDVSKLPLSQEFDSTNYYPFIKGAEFTVEFPASKK